MNYLIANYPYFPEKWPHTEYQYRLTFRPTGRDDAWKYDDEIVSAESWLHAGRLTDMITSHLNLWEIKTEMLGSNFALYCKDIGWLAILKLAHADDKSSPLQSLCRVESWSTSERPVSKHMASLSN